MTTARNGYLVKLIDRNSIPHLNGNPAIFIKHQSDIEEYLICNPHQNADMIYHQARTGQPVYWKRKEQSRKDQNWSCDFIYEFSLTPFED